MNLLEKISFASLFLGLALASGCGGDETTAEDLAEDTAAVGKADGLSAISSIPFAGGARFTMTTPGQPTLMVDVYTGQRTGQRAVVTFGGRTAEVSRAAGARMRDALTGIPGASEAIEALSIQLGTGYCSRTTGAYYGHRLACDAWDAFWA
jgi:hypothetical protein